MSLADKCRASVTNLSANAQTELLGTAMKSLLRKGRIEVADTASNGPKLMRFRDFLP